MGTADNQQCRRTWQQMVCACRGLGVPLSPEKLEGPATPLKFLLICINSVTSTLGVPEDSTAGLVAEINLFLERRICTKRQMLSLIGLLGFVNMCVPAKRIAPHHQHGLSSRRVTPPNFFGLRILSGYQMVT